MSMFGDRLRCFRRVRILQQMLKAKEEEVEMMSGKSKDLLEGEL